MQFKDIPGMDHLKKNLIRSARIHKLAHAQIFYGREGSANLALALAFATYLQCDDPGAEDSCGTCPACKKNAKFIHPDLFFVMPVTSTAKITGKDVISQNFLKEFRLFLQKSPYGNLTDWSGYFQGDNKQFNISKEESRQIIRNLSLTSVEGKYKVMIIWLPENMHPAAANAILKILEEPPEKTLFLLVSNAADQLLTTIRSRTQWVSIPPLSKDEVAGILEKNGASTSLSRQIAQAVDGNVTEGLRLLNEEQNDNFLLFRDWMRLSYSGDHDRLIRLTEDFSKLKKSGQKNLMIYGLSMYREALLMIYGQENLVSLPEQEHQFIRDFCKVLKAENIDRICDLLNTAVYHLERNANVKLLFLDLSLQVHNLLRKR